MPEDEIEDREVERKRGRLTRHDPSRDPKTATFDEWCRKNKFDPKTRTYKDDPAPPRAVPNAHPGTHRPT